MAEIPDKINNVTIEFSPSVKKNVDRKIIDALSHVLGTDIATGHVLKKIYISSANDQHTLPSRHVQGAGKAVDISRINGMRMSSSYPANATVKAITDLLQTRFETFTHRRENFGPSFKKKLGRAYNVPGHADHIHFSVN